jgi:predicted dinucleotide-binding enzyme
MNKMTKIAISIVLTFCASSAFACDYPATPKELPNGAVASKDEMLEGVKVIAAYQEVMATYLSCIESEEIVAIQAIGDDEEAKEQRETMFEKKYNAAVDEQTRTVERFNAEIRAYKAR